MYIDKTIKKYIFIGLIIVLMLPQLTYADNSMGEMKDKIDNQNEYIYDEILKNKNEDNNPLGNIMDDVKEKDNKGNKTIDLSNVSNNIHKGSILIALNARKYIVPVTILILLFNVFMLSATGAKSFKNRKKYILGSVFFFVFFLIVLNFPIYLLWRYSTGAEGFLSFEGFYRFVEGVSLFLKENSFVFFIIIFTFGIINMISSDYNYPKKMASQFMVKMSFVLLLLFNLLPYILKLAV